MIVRPAQVNGAGPPCTVTCASVGCSVRRYSCSGEIVAVTLKLCGATWPTTSPTRDRLTDQRGERRQDAGRARLDALHLRVGGAVRVHQLGAHHHDLGVRGDGRARPDEHLAHLAAERRLDGDRGIRVDGAR